MCQKTKHQRFVFLFVPVLFICFTWRYQAGIKDGLSPYQEVDTIDGVWMEADPATVSPEGAMFVIHNMTGRMDFETNPEYCIEKKRGNVWYTIPDLYLNDSPRAVLAIAWYIPSDSFEHPFPQRYDRYDWTRTYGELPPGEYRFLREVTSLLDIPLSEDSSRYYLSAEFTVG